MKLLPWMLIAAAAINPDASAENGVVNVASIHSVSQTIDRLELLVESRQLTVFARIDFSGDAAKAGLSMPPTASKALVEQTSRENNTTASMRRASTTPRRRAAAPLAVVGCPILLPASMDAFLSPHSF